MGHVPSGATGSLLGERNQESAAGTLRSSLGKFCPFPNSGGSISDGPPFAKEKLRKEGLEPTFRLEGKDNSIQLERKRKKEKKSQIQTFFFFSKCVRAGQGLIPDRRGVLRGGSSSLRERQARKVASRVDKAR